MQWREELPERSVTAVPAALGLSICRLKVLGLRSLFFMSNGFGKLTDGSTVGRDHSALVGFLDVFVV